MKQMTSSIPRRDFLKFSAVAAGALVLVTVSPRAGAQISLAKALSTSIATNHGHAFSIELEQLLENGEATYDIKGGAIHNHTIEVTNEVLRALQENGMVEIESSALLGLGHTHIVTLSIA